jgi:hypothetical protein
MQPFTFARCCDSPQRGHVVSSDSVSPDAGRGGTAAGEVSGGGPADRGGNGLIAQILSARP